MFKLRMEINILFANDSYVRTLAMALNYWRLFTLSRPGRESDSETEDFEHAEKLRQVKAVLEEVILFPFVSCICILMFQLWYNHSIVFSYVHHKCVIPGVDLAVLHTNWKLWWTNLYIIFTNHNRNYVNTGHLSWKETIIWHFEFS